MKYHHAVRQLTLTAVSLCLWLCGSATAQIYKWTDADGAVHYSQTPPSQGYSEMQVAPRSSSAEEDGRQVQELINHQNDAADREAADKDKAIQEADQLAQRAALCVKAREQLAQLESGPPQRHLLSDPDGSVHRLSEQEHLEMVERVKKAIADNCGE